MTRLLIAATALLAVLSTQVSAQTVRVAVDIDDSDTGGLFTSAFTAAFRGLGDVVVVATDDAPDVILRGGTLCTSACNQTLSYVVALGLQWPLRKESIMLGLRSAQVPSANIQPALDSIVPYVNTYVQLGTSWLASWGRSTYERNVRELAARINSNCFDFVRLYKKQVPMTPSERHEFNTKDWTCGPL